LDFLFRLPFLVASAGSVVASVHSFGILDPLVSGKFGAWCSVTRFFIVFGNRWRAVVDLLNALALGDCCVMDGGCCRFIAFMLAFVLSLYNLGALVEANI